MTSLSIMLLGLALGLRHATDPDHVVAIGTIVTRDPRLRRAIGTGVFWGIGHMMTVLVVGALMLIAGVRVPDRVVALMDLAVAAMLIGLGVVALRTKTGSSPASATWSERALVSPLRPFLVGIVHGLAGSAAMTLLALSTLRDERVALVYLALFGAGTVVGMMGITAILAISLRWLGGRSAVVPVWIARGSGMISVAAGLLVVAQTVMP